MNILPRKQVYQNSGPLFIIKETVYWRLPLVARISFCTCTNLQVQGEQAARRPKGSLCFLISQADKQSLMLRTQNTRNALIPIFFFWKLNKRFSKILTVYLNHINNNSTTAHLADPGYLQIDDSICAHSLHGVELQVALEVSSIEPGNRQTVTKTSLE